MRLTALSEGEQSYLIRILSDLESGHARQWYWLEIAQSLASPQKTRRSKALGIAVKLLGIKVCSPILLGLKTRGLTLYRRAAEEQVLFWRNTLHDMLLFTGSLLALLAGFRLLPASMQFALWCLCFLAISQQMFKTYSTAPAAELNERELLSAESSLGLTPILLAAGLAPQLSLTLIKGLKQNPDEFVAPLLINLPALAPSPTLSKPARCLQATLIYLAVCIITANLIGLLSGYWGLVVALTTLFATALWIFDSRKAVAMVAGTWVACFALASIAHLI